MKLILTVFLFFALRLLPCGAVEPVADLKAYSGLKATDVMYRWVANLGGASNVVFLSTKQDYLDELHDEEMPSWVVYLPAGAASDYIQMSRLKEHEHNFATNTVAIHLDRMFIGRVTQLGKMGIVTAQIDRPRKEPPVAYVYAYTLEGKSMRQTLLATYDPDRENRIYNQYLAENKRARVIVEEVNP